MNVVDAPIHAPGSCALSGTSTGPFIDTLRDFDDFPSYGRLYISFDAVSDMGQKLGFATPAVRENLEAQIVALTADNARLLGELDRLEPLKHAFEGLVADTRTPTHRGHDVPAGLGAELAEATGDPAFVDEPQLPDGHGATGDPADTPDGHPLPDDAAAILLLADLFGFDADDAEVAAANAEVIQEIYGAGLTSIDDLIAIDPPPDLVKAIHEWVDERPEPVIRAIRRTIAVTVESEKPVDKRRPGVMQLGPEED